MAQQIEVMYTQGIFCPVAPLEMELEEGQRLTLILPDDRAEQEDWVEDVGLRQWCAKQAGE